MNPLYLVGAAVIGGALLGAKKAYAYVGGKPVEIDLVDIGGGFKLARPAANAFIVMRAAAAKDGIVIKVNSAFRSMEEQTSLWNAYQAGTGNLAARPGYSNHQNGIAVDIDVDGSFVSEVYKWLNEFGGQFDWINTGKNFSQKEPWHWEYKP
jgi:LAS superfamily LD-carboxypeptidase LdcB